MAPTTLAPTALGASTAMLLPRFATSAVMVNGVLTIGPKGGFHGAGDRDPASARRALLRGLRPRRGVRASAHPHGDPDGQHAVLQHDAQSAAAPYRPAFLRARDRMGSAPDEFSVYS